MGRYVKSHRGPAAGSLTLTVYDTLGAFQALNIDVTVSEPPTVTINAAGEEVTGPMTVSSGTTIDCEVVASDPDGIGSRSSRERA